MHKNIKGKMRIYVTTSINKFKCYTRVLHGIHVGACVTVKSTLACKSNYYTITTAPMSIYAVLRKAHKWWLSKTHILYIRIIRCRRFGNLAKYFLFGYVVSFIICMLPYGYVYLCDHDFCLALYFARIWHRIAKERYDMWWY